MCNALSVEAYEKECSKRIMLSAVTMRNCVVVAPIQARGGSSTTRPDGKSRHQQKRNPNENLWVRKRGIFLLPGQLVFEKMVHYCLEKLRGRTISLLCRFSWLRWPLSSQWAKNLFVRAAKLYSTDDNWPRRRKGLSAWKRSRESVDTPCICCARKWDSISPAFPMRLTSRPGLGSVLVIRKVQASARAGERAQRTHM